MPKTTTKSSKKNKGQENANKALGKLVEMFTSGDMPEAIARTVIARAADSKPSDSWSLSNQLLMWLADTEDARGFKAWEQVGRRVLAGSKAFYILAPMMRKIEEDDGKGGTVERRIPIGFRGVPVFRYEDTEGDDVPTPEYEPVELPPLMDVAERLGVPSVRYLPYSGREYGSYILGSREIRLKTHDVGTWFHELAHAAHATFEKLTGGQQPEQEIVAETAAAVLCLMYGGEGRIRGSADYIKSYGGDNPGRCVVKVMSKVQKVLDVILQDQGETEEIAA